MHPAVEAGLNYWRAVNEAGKDWARINIEFVKGREDIDPIVHIHIGQIFDGQKQAYIMTRSFYFSSLLNRVCHIDLPHS